MLRGDMEKPLVSVITPSLNQGRFIEQTIKSVLSQEHPHLEHIVIDGGSTDGTVEILRKYEDKIQWTSEPDYGQADAVNKGFSMTKGEILGWLNSDDTYNPGAVSTVVKHFLQYPEIVMVYGDAYFIDEDGNITGKYPTEQFKFKRLADTCFICQPTVFVRREVFKKIGFLDINLQTCMDYDYWIRIGKSYPETTIGYLKGKFLANSRSYSENKSTRLRDIHYREVMETAKKYFDYVSPFWTVGYMIRTAEEKMRGFEKSNVIVKTLLRIFHIAKIFGMRWGYRYFTLFLKEWVLRNLKR
jgi:glycosyltransferase involved in cell wall biosynthesis